MKSDSLIHEPVFLVFCSLAILGIAIRLFALRRRKRVWIMEAQKRGFSYFDEDGKKGSGQGVATSSETDHVKSFTFRCLQGGYHVHVLCGNWQSFDALVVDYEQKKFPKDLQTEMQQSSAAMTYPRTVYALRKSKGCFPSLLVSGRPAYAEGLGWLNPDDQIPFPEDPVFAERFAVCSPDPEQTKALLNADVRAFLLERAADGFHLETRGRDAAIHYGKHMLPKDTSEHLVLLSALMQHLQDG